MAAVPQINFTAPVQSLALHDVGGPGRIARAQAQAAQQVAQAGRKTVEANARAAKAEFGVKQTNTQLAFDLRLSGLKDDMQQIEDMDRVAQRLFDVGVGIDNQIQQDQMQEAELIYEREVGASMAAIGADTHRIEQVDPNDPTKGTRPVSNADVLVDRTTQAMYAAESRALAGVDNARARDKLETAFAKTRGAQINKAAVTSIGWQRTENTANASLRIEQALVKGDTAQARRFLEDSANSGLFSATEIYNAGRKIDIKEQVNGYSDEIDRLFTVYDGRTSARAAEAIHKEMRDPNSPLTAGDRSMITRAVNGKVEEHWMSQVQGIIAMPAQTLPFDEKMNSLEDMATGLASIPVGQDGFAPGGAKQTLLNKILSARTSMKTFHNAELKAVREDKKQAVEDAKLAAKQVTGGAYQDMWNIMEAGSGTFEQRYVAANRRIAEIQGTNPEALFPDAVTAAEAQASSVKLVGDLNTALGRWKTINDNEESTIEGMALDKNDKYENWLNGRINEARRQTSSDAQYLGMAENIRDNHAGLPWYATGVSDETVYREHQRMLDTTVRTAKTEANAEIKAMEQANLAHDMSTGAFQIPLVGASADETAAFEGHYASIRAEGVENELDPRVIDQMQLQFMVQQVKPTAGFETEVQRGLVSDNPNDFMREAGRLVQLTEMGRQGPSVYREVVEGLSRHEQSLVQFGTERVKYGLDLTPEMWEEYRTKLDDTSKTELEARANWFKSKMRTEDGVQVGLLDMAKIAGENGQDINEMPEGMRQTFLTAYKHAAQMTPFSGNSMIPEPARMAYHDTMTVWALTATGSGGWVHQGMETRVAGGSDPQWIAQEVNAAAKDAGVYNMDDVTQLSGRVNNADGTSQMGTAFRDNKTGEFRLHGRGSKTGREGDLFLLPDPVYEESMASKKAQQKAKAQARQNAITLGKSKLSQAIQLTPEYNSRSEAVNMIRDVEATPYSSGTPSYVKQMMLEMTEAAEFMYPDPQGVASNPHPREMYWVEKEVRERYGLLVEKGIMTETSAGRDIQTVMEMIKANAAQKEAFQTRKQARIDDAKTIDIWMP